MMTEFEKLKSTCAEKEKIVTNLNKTFCNKLILRDMGQLLCENANIVHQAENKFMWDHICITVYDGILNLEDRRGTAFLWGFEIKHDKQMRLGDIFENEGKPLSVSYIRFNNDPKLLSKIRDVIAEFDKSIVILSANDPIDTRTYKYYDCHEDVTCNSIEEVLDTVAKREYR